MNEEKVEGFPSELKEKAEQGLALQVQLNVNSLRKQLQYIEGALGNPEYSEIYLLMCEHPGGHGTHTTQIEMVEGVNGVPEGQSAFGINCCHYSDMTFFNDLTMGMVMKGVKESSLTPAGDKGWYDNKGNRMHFVTFAEGCAVIVAGLKEELAEAEKIAADKNITIADMDDQTMKAASERVAALKMELMKELLSNAIGIPKDAIQAAGMQPPSATLH